MSLAACGGCTTGSGGGACSTTLLGTPALYSATVSPPGVSCSAGLAAVPPSNCCLRSIEPHSMVSMASWSRRSSATAASSSGILARYPIGSNSMLPIPGPNVAANTALPRHSVVLPSCAALSAAMATFSLAVALSQLANEAGGSLNSHAPGTPSTLTTISLCSLHAGTALPVLILTAEPHLAIGHSRQLRVSCPQRGWDGSVITGGCEPGSKFTPS